MMIKLENIRKQYPGFTLDLSLSVPEGTITGLIGRNGSGKTTTFKAILGLISPDHGSAEVFGKSVDTLPVSDKQRIGVVLSDSGFPPVLKIRELIPVLRNFYPAFDEEWFLKMLKDFQLPENRRISELSTGLHARLKILCALCHHPDLLILDEPTAGLDVVARTEILDLLRKFMETDGRSILISSHISSDLENFCDEFCLIDNGKLILHEDANRLDEDYCILTMKPELFSQVEKEYLSAYLSAPFGIQALSSHKDFWLENYPEVSVEKAGLDQILEIMIKGERV